MRAYAPIGVLEEPSRTRRKAPLRRKRNARRLASRRRLALARAPARGEPKTFGQSRKRSGLRSKSGIGAAARPHVPPERAEGSPRLQCERSGFRRKPIGAPDEASAAKCLAPRKAPRPRFTMRYRGFATDLRGVLAGVFAPVLRGFLCGFLDLRHMRRRQAHNI
jgi:hypothetical protein